MSHHIVTSSTAAPSFRHEALIYDDPSVLYRELDVLIRSAAARSSVLVSLTAERLAGLHEAMGTPALPGVEWLATTEWRPHAARRLRDVGDRFGRAEAAGRPSLVIAETPWRLEEGTLVAEWTRADAAANTVLAGRRGGHLVCVYDAVALPAHVISTVRTTHPGPAYVEPHDYLAADAPSPSRLVVPDRAVSLEAPDAAGARQLARDWAARAGLDSVVAGDFCLSVSEVATNAILHGRDPVCCSAWLEAGWLWCQVDDAGPGVVDLLAGYPIPGRSAASGRGLWLTRQLVDAVQLAPAHRADGATGAHGSSVRLGVLS